MVCQKCGSAIREGAKFCPGCGASSAPPPAVAKTALFQQPAPQIETVAPPVIEPPPPPPPPKKKRSVVKILAVVFVVLLFLGAGVVVAGIFGFRYLVKSSESYKAAVSALEHSKSARDSLGTIVDTGFPSSSSVSEAGGSGSAKYTMSVKGSKASGSYDATLELRGGHWVVTSGKVKLENGGSVDLDLTESALPSGTAKGEGRQLASAAADSSAWTEQHWTQQLMRFRLPSDWIVMKMDQRELDCRKGEKFSSTYMVGNGYIFDQPLPTANLLTAEVKSAAEKLHNGIIEGYAVREIGGNTGLVEITNVGGKRIVTWQGLVQAGGKQRQISVSVAAEYKDYDGLESVFAGILDSIHFD